MENENDLLLTIYQLSHIDAEAEYENYQLCLDRGAAGGNGVSFSVQCDGEGLRFWVTESELCDWVTPLLAVPSLSQIAPELLGALADWTLAPLDNWLEGGGALSPAIVSLSAPPPYCWRLILRSDSRQLYIYLAQVSETWIRRLMSHLQPVSNRQLTLKLALGWCLVSVAMIENIVPGDALPVVGMEDTLDEFWLHPTASPGKIQLLNHEQATIISTEAPLSNVPSGSLAFIVEVGEAQITVSELSFWHTGTDISLHANPSPLLQLTHHGIVYAQGTLLRFDDGWAFRVDTPLAPFPPQTQVHFNDEENEEVIASSTKISDTMNP